MLPLSHLVDHIHALRSISMMTNALGRGPGDWGGVRYVPHEQDAQ